jgi:hypothetical protein
MRWIVKDVGTIRMIRVAKPVGAKGDIVRTEHAVVHRVHTAALDVVHWLVPWHRGWV